MRQFIDRANVEHFQRLLERTRMRPSVIGYWRCWLRRRPKSKYSMSPPKGDAASQYDRTPYTTLVPVRCRSFDCPDWDGCVSDFRYGKCKIANVASALTVVRLLLFAPSRIKCPKGQWWESTSPLA
jgi:hypothetical protein